jgi:hypothetical protein
MSRGNKIDRDGRRGIGAPNGAKRHSVLLPILAVMHRVSGLVRDARVRFGRIRKNPRFCVRDASAIAADEQKNPAISVTCPIG